MFYQTNRSVIAIILFITFFIPTTFIFSEENTSTKKQPLRL